MAPMDTEAAAPRPRLVVTNHDPAFLELLRAAARGGGLRGPRAPQAGRAVPLHQGASGRPRSSWTCPSGRRRRRWRRWTRCASTRRPPPCRWWSAPPRRGRWTGWRGGRGRGSTCWPSPSTSTACWPSWRRPCACPRPAGARGDPAGPRGRRGRLHRAVPGGRHHGAGPRAQPPIAVTPAGSWPRATTGWRSATPRGPPGRSGTARGPGTRRTSWSGCRRGRGCWSWAAAGAARRRAASPRASP